MNIAARLASVADGRGICISSNVYEQVENKLDVSCLYQGEQTVKTIAKPVRVYKIDLGTDPADRVGVDSRVRADSADEETAARLVDSEGITPRTTAALFRAKYVIGEAVARITRTALTTCGAQALFKTGLLGQLFRDGASAPIMSPNSDASCPTSAAWS